MQYLLGINIPFLQDILLYIAIFFLTLYLISLVIAKKPHWFLSNNLRQCFKLQEKFEKLTSSRRDMLHHFYWARSENDTKKMKSMDKDLTRIDIQIAETRENYERKRAKLTKLVQKMM